MACEHPPRPRHGRREGREALRLYALHPFRKGYKSVVIITALDSLSSTNYYWR